MLSVVGGGFSLILAVTARRGGGGRPTNGRVIARAPLYTSPRLRRTLIRNNRLVRVAEIDFIFMPPRRGNYAPRSSAGLARSRNCVDVIRAGSVDSVVGRTEVHGLVNR